MPDAANVLGRFQAAKIVPVLRSRDTATLERDVARLADAGLGVIEATTSTPGWSRVLGDLVAAYPTVDLGVGTIRDVADARVAVDAGAAFLVTPYVVPGLRAWADAERIPLLEAGFTPGELAAAGAPARPVKLFPASVGGATHVAAMIAVLPGSHIVATGGISPAGAGAYLAAGAIAVGIGSALVDAPDPAAVVVEALGGAAT